MGQNEKWNKFYETAWGFRHQKIEEMIESGYTNPFTLVEKMKRMDETFRLGTDFATGEPFFVRTYKEQSSSPEPGYYPTGKPFLRSRPFEEESVPTAYYHSCVDFILDYLEEREFDAIVELGSGFAQNLVELAYRGGPKNIPYYAGEFTESGNKLAKRLAELSDFELIPFEFDYKNPDFSALGKHKKIFFFTSHSIEQVTDIPLSLFKGMVDSADYVECVHFEPFGFQLELNGQKNSKVSEGHKMWMEGNEFNRNLGPLLLEAHGSGVIELTFVSKNTMGLEVLNPTSIAVWRTPQAKGPGN